MKKIISISLVFLLLSVASFAQRDASDRISKESNSRYSDRKITKGERVELRKDAARYKAVKHHARKDGKITPRERKRLHKMRKHNRHDAFHAKHHRHHHRHHRVK